MATAQPTPAVAQPAAAQAAARPASAVKAETNPAQALVPVSQPLAGKDQLKGPVTRLPVELDVVVPVGDFRVRQLLALEPGNVIQSQWSYGEDVPLAAGDVQLAWSEFEVIDGELAVRITRLP